MGTLARLALHIDRLRAESSTRRWWQLPIPGILLDLSAERIAPATSTHSTPTLPDSGQHVRGAAGVNPGRRPPVGLGVDSGGGEHDDPAVVGRVDPDDTSNCPVDWFCESCQSCQPGADLAVATAQTPLGVVCVTLCADCADAGTLPRFIAYGAMVRTLEHCEHLGCSLEDLAR